MLVNTTREIDRFLSLFDQLVEQTFEFVRSIDNSVYSAIPVDTDTLFLGTRVNKITVGALLRHIILAETHWFKMLTLLKTDEVMPFPQNASLLEQIEDGQPLLNEYKSSYANSRQLLLSLSSDDLDKQLSFAGRQYTVLGFLWTILGHHSFHLGQIDLLLRQQSIMPPEYMEWAETTRVLG
jgi:uncharacterized damage-inducible protein DinB